MCGAVVVKAISSNIASGDYAIEETFLATGDADNVLAQGRIISNSKSYTLIERNSEKAPE